jgi:hypothetical protein
VIAKPLHELDADAADEMPESDTSAAKTLGGTSAGIM